MTGLLGWIRRRLKIDVEKESPIEVLVKSLLEKLGKDFVRKLRDTVFAALQRKCERRIWGELLKLADEELTEARRRRGALRESKSTQKALGMALGGIDQGAISNAQKGKNSPLSLARLLVALIHLEKHWGALGELSPFAELRDECVAHAIGIAQRAYNARSGLPLPVSDYPTTEELATLRGEYPEDQGSAHLNNAWKTWGEGWLITTRTLGFTRGLKNESDE